MKILFLAHRFPFPPNKGDKIRSFNILQYLARRHEVHLACLIDDAADVKSIPRLQSLVRSVAFAVIRPPLRRLTAMGALLRSQSLTVSYFYSSDLQRRIDELIATRAIDAIFCSSSPMAEYAFRSRHWSGSLRHARRIMDLIDVDSLKWRQYAQSSPPWKAWIYRYEARQLAAYERRIGRAFERLFVVSESEKDHFPGDPVEAKLQAMSNGVDLEFFSPAQHSRPQDHAPTIVFTGVMDYWPNVEGVKWFVAEVLPRIRSAIPDIQFLIVGSRPTAEVRRLQSSRGVTVTGFVDDVRTFARRADVCVAPLSIARGVQNKILEAMAMGKATVTTPQAYEGLRARAGEDIVVAEGATQFATAVIDLLLEKNKRERIGSNARRCVERYYSWDENLRPLDDVLPADASLDVARAAT